MSEHTPGPWRVMFWEHEPNEYKPFYHEELVVEQADKPHSEVAVFPLSLHDYDERAEIDANACLIAAAPELLEAVKKTLAVFNSDPGYSEVALLKKAIAKAEGKVEHSNRLESR